MKKFWEQSYKPPTNQSNALLTASQPPLTNRPKNDFFEWLAESQDDEIDDEYDIYCLEPAVQGIKEGVYWWLEPTQRKGLPHLSKMAINILLIPAMSADPERLFSGAKITITDRQNRLGIKTI